MKHPILPMQVRVNIEDCKANTGAIRLALFLPPHVDTFQFPFDRHNTAGAGRGRKKKAKTTFIAYFFPAGILVKKRKR